MFLTSMIFPITNQKQYEKTFSKFTSYLKDELNLNLNNEDIKEMFQELIEEGYIETAEGYIYLKENEETFEDFAKEEIEEMLDNPYEVTNLFDTDDIVEMWVNEKSKEEAVEIYLRHNTIFDALNLSKPKLAFYDEEIGKVMIARYN
ncbi:MAG: hypothetical protein N2Z71_00790 [Caloramator sp.]|nr:hypothetical protein [Caloramator sp.]